MIKLKDLIKEFVPGTMLDARKKPGDYWKGAITDTWYARSPKYGWRNSFDTEEEAKMWAEEGKDLEGYDEETAEHPPEPIEEFVNEDAIPYAVGFPIVRKFADRLSFGPGLKRDGNTFFLVANMKIDNAAIKKELQRHYEIRRIDRGSRGSNEYYVYDKDSGYVMLVQPSKKDNWIQMSPFTTIEDWKKYE